MSGGQIDKVSQREAGRVLGARIRGDGAGSGISTAAVRNAMNKVLRIKSPYFAAYCEGLA